MTKDAPARFVRAYDGVRPLPRRFLRSMVEIALMFAAAALLLAGILYAIGRPG